MDPAVVDCIRGLGSGEPREPRRIGGGCISDAFRVDTASGASYFVKVNHDLPLGDFVAEARGLELIVRTGTVRAPKPFGYGDLASGGGAYLVCEHLDMAGLSARSQVVLGSQLAAMHLSDLSDEHGGRFGLSFDNTCGATPQVNTPCSDWAEFFALRRLRFQCERIHKSYGDGELAELGRRLESRVPALMEGAGRIQPALIHGDLWGGNAAQVVDGVPCIFDPAPYFAHAEMELGMMSLFGGFSAACLAEYHRAIPKAPGFDERQDLYTLYHVLNHYNIFGRGYRSQAMGIMRGLLM